MQFKMHTHPEDAFANHRYHGEANRNDLLLVAHQKKECGGILGDLVGSRYHRAVWANLDLQPPQKAFKDVTSIVCVDLVSSVAFV